MNGYLGEKSVKIEKTPFAKFTKEDWALYFIEHYGQFDGGHHKQWTMDQVVRVLKGTPVKIKLAKWDNGEEEYRVTLADKPSKAYIAWVDEMRGETDSNGDREYGYDEGIAP